MEEDTMGLLDENFDYIIDEMRNDVIMIDSVDKTNVQE